MRTSVAVKEPSAVMTRQRFFLLLREPNLRFSECAWNPIRSIPESTTLSHQINLDSTSSYRDPSKITLKHHREAPVETTSKTPRCPTEYTKVCHQKQPGNPACDGRGFPTPKKSRKPLEPINKMRKGPAEHRDSAVSTLGNLLSRHSHKTLR